METIDTCDRMCDRMCNRMCDRICNRMCNRTCNRMCEYGYYTHLSPKQYKRSGIRVRWVGDSRWVRVCW